MNQYKKSVQKERAQRNMYIALCIVALVACVGYGAFSVVDGLVYDQPKFLVSKQVETLGRAQYRFREIYKGPAMTTTHSASGVAMPTISQAKIGGSHGSTVSAAPVVDTSVLLPASSSWGAALATTSSAETQSYGGGISAGGTSLGGNSSSNGVAQPAIGYSSVVVAVPNRQTAYAKKSSAADVSAPKVSGPRRIYASGDGEYDGEPNGSGMIWSEDEEGWITGPDPGTERDFNGTTYVWDGTTWMPKGGGHLNDVGTPVGDMPIVLLLLLAGGYVAVRCKRKMA